MLWLRKAILTLKYDDHLSTARVLEVLWIEASKCLDNKDLHALNALSKVVDDWLASINKWKVYSRRVLINLNRAEQDLESLSLRIRRLHTNIHRTSGHLNDTPSIQSEKKVQDAIRREAQDGEGGGPDL